MKENNIKNAGKALTITTVLTVFIAAFEMINALGFYKPGMNLLDIASYVQANKPIFAFTFIFGNLVLLPCALFLYRENGFIVENATERYIHFKKLFPDLSERIPQRHIATYLGITPESLSRIRGAMKENK